MSRFSSKTYRSVGTGLAPLTYIDAECAEMAWVLHNGILRRPNNPLSSPLVEVDDVHKDIAAYRVSNIPPTLAMWRSSGSQYHWWLKDQEGLVQYNQSLCAVAVLVCNSQGEFASIASLRRGGKIGFPAGGIEFWETPFEAASRELKEETGLITRPAELIFLDSTLIGGKDMVGYFWAPRYFGGLRSSEEGTALWSPPEVLLGDQGAFPDRNAWALSKLDMGVQVL